jgi:hypothetical protein
MLKACGEPGCTMLLDYDCSTNQNYLFIEDYATTKNLKEISGLTG